MKMEQTHAHGQRNWYDKSYKWLLIIPLLMLLFSVVYLYDFSHKNGDIINKDVSLTGGTTVSLFDSKIDIDNLKDALSSEFPDINVRGISNIQTGGQIGVIVETKENVEIIRPALEKYLGYKLTTENSSIEFTKATISSGFYQQLRNSMVAAFLLMACVVFLRFAKSPKIKSLVIMLTFLGVGIALADVPGIRTFSIAAIILSGLYGLWKGEKSKNKFYLVVGAAVVSLLILAFYDKMILLLPVVLVLIYLYIIDSMPSFMMILCAFADIVMTVVVVDLLGMTLSLAGIIAFLMLIGYSIDTDILMTTRLLVEKEGTKNQRLFGAFKTGMMMTLTAVAAVGASLLIIQNMSTTLHQIFTIVLIGLFFDIINTWITNASLLKWYVEAKHLD
jgi:preprotein translocase subunit SecF